MNNGVLMRPHNSVGGFRIYPTSPQVAELVERGRAIIGQFNEAMDRLNTERQLTERQQQQVDSLDPTSLLASNYQTLTTITNRAWQQALQIQENEIADEQRVFAISRHLNACANRWQGFKRQLDEHA